MAGRLVVTPLLAGDPVAGAGRLDAVTPRDAWVGDGGGVGPSVAARDGFRAVVSGAAGVNAGLWEGALGVPWGNCSSWSLGVDSS